MSDPCIGSDLLPLHISDGESVNLPYSAVQYRTSVRGTRKPPIVQRVVHAFPVRVGENVTEESRCGIVEGNINNDDDNVNHNKRLVGGKGWSRYGGHGELLQTRHQQRSTFVIPGIRRQPPRPHYDVCVCRHGPVRM